MFDITTGAWRPDEGVIVEVTVVPHEVESPAQLVLNTPGLALVEHARGGVSLGGVAGPSLTFLEPDDRIVLMAPGEFVLPLVVPLVDEQMVGCRAVVTIADPYRFVPAVVQNDLELTDVDIAQRLSRDGAVRLAIQRASDQAGTFRAEAIQARLAEPLDLLFGLSLREVLPAVMVNDGGGLTSALRRGEVVGGNWELVERLGQGAAGDVWLVRHTEQPELARALKILRNPAVAPLINREARRIIRLEENGLNFQYIARLIDLIPLDAPGLLYEYVPGDTLRDYVQDRGGALIEVEAVEISEQVLSGLNDLHRTGIVHRDLHPANIIVSETSAGRQVKILDLGMAALIEPEYGSASFRQSGLRLRPAHAFAERLPTGNPADPQTDLYSVGVLFWWMLTGEEGLPVGQRLEDAWPQGETKALDIVRRSALLPRDRRYSSAREMRSALLRVSQQNLSYPRPKGRVALSHRPSGRRGRGEKSRATFRQRHPFLSTFAKAGMFLGLFMVSGLLLAGGIFFGALRGAAIVRTVVIASVIMLAVPAVLFAMFVLTLAVLLLR